MISAYDKVFEEFEKCFVSCSLKEQVELLQKIGVIDERLPADSNVDLESTSRLTSLVNNIIYGFYSQPTKEERLQYLDSLGFPIEEFVFYDTPFKDNYQENTNSDNGDLPSEQNNKFDYIVTNIKNKLESFATREEKLTYLKSFGFDFEENSEGTLLIK